MILLEEKELEDVEETEEEAPVTKKKKNRRKRLLPKKNIAVGLYVSLGFSRIF